MTDEQAISEPIMAIIEEILPPFFTRKQAVVLLNGLFAESTLANLEHLGKGPEMHTMGRKRLYTKGTFLTWLRKYYGAMYVKYDGFGRRVCKRSESEDGAGEAGSGDQERLGAGVEAGDIGNDVGGGLEVS